MTNFGYEFEEDELFLEQLGKIGKIEHIDEALAILAESLFRNPYKFEIFSEPNLRIAKTKAYSRDGKYVPPLRVFFIIKESKKCDIINLKYMETIEYESDE